MRRVFFFFAALGYNASMLARIFSRLDKIHSWQLFLATVFPIQVWAILIGFWNFQTVVERSANLIDGIAYIAYALSAALVESLLLFVILFFIGFLFPKRFSSKRILAQLTLIAATIAFWMILDQLLALYEFQHPGAIAGIFLEFSRPYLFTILSGVGLLCIVVLVLVLPFYQFERKPEGVDTIVGVIDSIVPLSIIYLGLDILSIIFIIIRNT